MSLEEPTMKISIPMLVAGSMLLLPVAELVPFSPIGFGQVGEAHAVVGAPMTPGSVAGVARRTAVRTTAAASSAASASQAQAQAAAKPPAPAPAPSAGAAPAIGTVVGSLPNGCVSAPVSGVEYYLCNGVYYRAAFQGNNLVYVVAKP
jgi:hypothetical protein